MKATNLSVLQGPDVIMTERKLYDGVQKLYRFTGNDWGASVVRHSWSYGGKQGFWELAVIKWTEDECDLRYDTPITDDVLGCLSDEEVTETLMKIKSLNKFGQFEED